MDLRQLYYFLAVAETQNVSRAATRVWISQPALSRQLQLLEQELNVTLFERKARGVVLTEAGLLLQQRATAVLKDITSIKETLSAHAAEPVGTVTLGVPSALRSLLTARVACRFAELCPKALLRIHESTSRAIRDGVASGDTDVAIFSTEEPSHPFTAIPLVSESLVAIGAPTDDLSMSRPISVKRLCRSPLILTTYPNSLRQIVDRAVSKAGISCRVSMEVDMSALMIDLATQGLGYAVLPACAAIAPLSSGLISAAPIKDLDISWIAAHSKERALSIAGQALLRIITTEARRLALEGDWPTANLASNTAEVRP